MFTSGKTKNNKEVKFHSFNHLILIALIKEVIEQLFQITTFAKNI
jgi:hypothetical protein